MQSYDQSELQNITEIFPIFPKYFSLWDHRSEQGMDIQLSVPMGPALWVLTQVSQPNISYLYWLALSTVLHRVLENAKYNGWDFIGTKITYKTKIQKVYCTSN